MAEDIAHLYSLEHVEGLAYRTFARKRLPEQHPTALTEVSQIEPVKVASDSPAPEPEPEPVPLQAESMQAPAPVASPIPIEPLPVPATPPPVSTPQIRTSPAPARPGGSTAIALYSLAGGVGKTTITANLGRILCSLGEEVVLVDASGSGLLPFYFGTSDLRSGLRTFVAPGGGYRPMHVIGTEDVTEQWLSTAVAQAMQLGRRTLFDCGSASIAVLPHLLSMCGIILVPLLSDLNSFLTVPRIEMSLATMRARGLNVPQSVYIFNKVDANSPMDQEARNLAIRQIGDRLLSVSIRRSPDIPAAIADRMTVADHAPESAVSQDFMQLALQLRTMAPTHETVKIHGRWSEQ